MKFCSIQKDFSGLYDFFNDHNKSSENILAEMLQFDGSRSLPETPAVTCQ